MGSNFSKGTLRTQEAWKKDPPRCPRYQTPDSLRRMGVPEDFIRLLHPGSTPIAYAEANKRNEVERRRFQAEQENAGKKHIPSYYQNSYIVKAPPNPQMTGPVAHFHNKQNHPGQSDWLASREALQRSMDQQRAQDARTHVRNMLDLPPASTASYVSRADVYPGFYQVELSFNRLGTPQANVPRQNTFYSDTQRTNDYFKKGP